MKFESWEEEALLSFTKIAAKLEKIGAVLEQIAAKLGATNDLLQDLYDMEHEDQ